MSEKPYEVRWGILATGWIAEKFSKDLLLSPQNPLADHSIIHTITAVASSTSQSRACEFLSSLPIPPPNNDAATKAYGTYAELTTDPDVDIIYIASPHSHHYRNARLALEAGKHVLCEKAFTVTASQARILVDIAKAKDLFLMEALWTRFLPISIEITNIIARGDVGRVYRVLADNSLTMDPGSKTSISSRWKPEGRLLNPSLAGGVLLDSGVYSLSWVFMCLYHTLPEKERRAPKRVVGVVDKFKGTGVDESSSVIVAFEKGPGGGRDRATAVEEEGEGAQGIATSSFRVATHPEGKHGAWGAGIRIQASKTEIQIQGPAYRPEGYRILTQVCGGVGEVIKEKTFDIPVGHGLFFQADEVGRCLRQGKLQSEIMPWEESVLVMDVMDEVRRQGEIKYPDGVESV